MTHTPRHLVAALLLLSLSALSAPRVSAAQSPPSASNQANDQEPAPILIPMELLANRPLVRAMVNGQGPFAFLVVPASRRTLIDPELGEALKIKRSGNTAPEASVELAFQGKHTVKTTVVVEDIAGYVAEFPVPTRPRGVLSLTTWPDHLVTLDYPRWKLNIEPGSLDEPDGKSVFALTSALELLLPLVVADQSVDCHVDPMFPSDLLVPSSLLAGDPPRPARDVGVLRTRSGIRRVREARLQTSPTLGPFQLKTPLVLMTDTAEPARIGAAWLGRYEVTYDLAHERIRIGRSSPIMSGQ